MLFLRVAIRCPGGESVEEMTARVDGLIARIHEVHRQYYEEGIGQRDCMVVAHVRHFYLTRERTATNLALPSCHRVICRESSFAVGSNSLFN